MAETYFIVAGILIIALFAIRIVVVSHTLVLVYIAFLTSLCVNEWLHLDQEVSGLLHADALGVLFLSMTAIITFFSAIHYIIYAKKRNQGARAISIHNGSFVIFVT